MISAIILLTAVVFGLSCQANQSILNSKSDTDALANSANAAPQMNDFERDLKSMQTANFDFIYVFRRKDGGKLDAEDRQFVKTNSPYETNRFIVSDQDQAVIAGSNTRFKPEQLKALNDRFVVADFSKPESELQKTNPPADANANANSNSSANANK